MAWTETHGRLLATAFERILGRPQPGAVAFTRCLAGDVIQHLAESASFNLAGWECYRVADTQDAGTRSITADKAVEWREDKRSATLLVVDVTLAGAGMDGIYSASKEIDEASLFNAAIRLAGEEITRLMSGADRQYAERAIGVAKRADNGHGVSPWAAFDFLVHVAEYERRPGAQLHRVGLWPIRDADDSDPTVDLQESRKLVDRLLGVGATGLSIPARIDSLQLDGLDSRGRANLERFLQKADALPILVAMEMLADQPDLWVGVVQVPSAQIQGIDLTSWRLQNGKLARWSGLVEDSNDPVPSLVLKANAESAGDYSALEVRWRPRPSDIAKGTLDYQVAVLTNNMEEDLAVREVTHSAGKYEKCRFNNDDFDMLDEDALISAKIVISVLSHDNIERQESEEFLIRFGEPTVQTAGGAGKSVRAFSEGLIELGNRNDIAVVADNPAVFDFDAKRNTALLRTKGGKRLSWQVHCPPLLHEVGKQWVAGAGDLGRWRVQVRDSGVHASAVEFLPADQPDTPTSNRVRSAGRRLAESLGGNTSLVSHVYDDQLKSFDLVKSYLLAWAALLEEGDPLLALCNTVEVQSLSGTTIGLIVLPIHPLRLAWHVAYDNLVLHAACEEKQNPTDIRNEFQCLDGAMFPAFLPNPAGGAFVFADTLGFHAVGMVTDTDKEPKAAVAILARALGDTAATDSAPTVGGRSARLIGEEIAKYLDCHDASHLLHIHALRAGDGLTVAKSLGHVHERWRIIQRTEDEPTEDDEATRNAPAFSLEMYPSREQRGIAGRYISSARERRRSGSGVVDVSDRWMLESVNLPGGVTMPRLRWAKKDQTEPNTAAHVALAFDTFESQVCIGNESDRAVSPFRAFGLLCFFERQFSATPSPVWRSVIPASTDGEKHPSERSHTERLERLQRATQAAVARYIGRRDDTVDGGPVLYTSVAPDKEDDLRRLHEHCDWVVTVDRNGGIEYFDSPRDNQAAYDAYVIDCVPEREDLGCFQLITSTSNLDEVRTLLDDALDQMGLSRSRRNAEFLLEHLKALSGRLAIRLTGNKPPTSELIALAISHAQCRQAADADPCWLALTRGFVVPVDDVQDLVPSLKEAKDEKRVRSDLIYVTMTPRKGLQFRFVEVKYRRDLRAARSADLLRHIKSQMEGMRKRWERTYSHEESPVFRSLRRAKLSRVLRFYADKARRHYLPADIHGSLVAEIDRMIEKGTDYRLGVADPNDLGWVFSPEYTGNEPLQISPDEWSGPGVFLFGPAGLPDPGDHTIQLHSAEAASMPDGELGGLSSDISVVQRVANPTPSSETSGERPVTNHIPTILLGTDGTTGTDVSWSLGINGNPHLLIAGLPGMGKTTCLLNLCRQMTDADVKPIVFSYHEDIDGKLEEALDSVRFLDFNGLGFNPLHVVDRNNRSAHLDVAGAIRDIFKAIYPDLGDIQADRVRKAIRDSFVESGWGTADSQTELQEPAFRRFIEILHGDPKPNQSMRSLMARLDELDDYGFFHVADSHGSLWESDQATVIRIHGTQNDNLQRAFAYLVFYGLYKDMFRRGIQDRITHALIFDEAHRAAGLKLIPTMAKECRKYGISLILASQEARDFHVSVFSSIANYLVLRMNEADAKALVRNVSDSRHERSLTDRIKQMDRFEALYFREGTNRATRIDLAP